RPAVRRLEAQRHGSHQRARAPPRLDAHQDRRQPRGRVAPHVLAILGLVLPLGLDTFAVSATLGAIGVDRAQRLRLSLIFVALEGLMPLLGLLIGDQLGERVGGVGEYAAIAALFALGVYELRQDEEAEEALVKRMSRARGAILVTAGLAVSLDELAI